MILDWDDYDNFSKEEFDCQETGENSMRPQFMDKLQTLRDRFGKSMKITSGYRAHTHSIEAKKDKPGTHARGIAADIAVFGPDKYLVAKIAFDLGFTGIGIHRKFIHLDLSSERKAIWSY